MKQSLLILGAIILMYACAPPSSDPSAMTIPELQDAIKEKKTEISNLNKELKSYELALEEKDSSSNKVLTNVTVDTVKRTNFEHHVDIQAVVQSEDQVYASAEIGGNITRLYVKEGQYVRRGSLIATIDVASMASQRGEIESQLSLAKDLFERQKTLWDQEIGSEVQFLQAKNRVENLEKSLKTLDTNLAKGKVYAPQSGIVEMLNAKQGEFAGPGSPIAMIVSNRDLKVVAQVPEKYLPNIVKGQSITINFPNLGLSQESSISLIGSTINEGNRTFKIEAPIEIDDKNLIKPNLLAMVELVDFSKDNVITVPSELVQQEVSGQNFVLIAVPSKDGNYVSKKKNVVTGENFNNAVLINEGISEGDYVIITGARGLSSDIPINILSSAEARELFSNN